MIYADFEIILLTEHDGKQNPNEFYTNNIKDMLLAVMIIN